MPPACRRSALGPLALTAGLVGLALSAGPARADSGLMMSSDYAHHRLRIYDPAAGRIVYDLPTWGDAGVAAGCLQRSPLACSPMGFTYVNHGDLDYIDLAMDNVSASVDDFDNPVPTVISRVELSTPPRTVWQVRSLDFRGIDPDVRLCPQGDDEPYGDPTIQGCSLQFVHEFRVVEDNPALELVRLVVTDSLTGRLVGIRLDYSRGSTVGEVEWVLGPEPGEWIPGFPNSVQALSRDDGDYLLVTYYAEGSLTSDGGPLAMYRWEGDHWIRAWQYPDPTAGERPYLLNPHMAKVITDPITGEDVLFYAHGRGLADDWDTNPNYDLGGSYGVMRLGASLSDAPTYLGEIAIRPDDPEDGLRYSRDIELLDDGTVLISDASCESFCGKEAKVFHLPAFHRGMRPSPKEGYFSPDHAQQAITYIEDDVDIIRCGLGGIFESQFVPDSDLGRYLRSASRTALRPCPD